MTYNITTVSEIKLMELKVKFIPKTLRKILDVKYSRDNFYISKSKL